MYNKNIIKGGIMNFNELDFNLIKTFIAVAESKSISSASEKLFISQPAVSSSVKKLEKFLGGALFTRTNKGIVLTKEGEDFYDYCKNALQTLENAVFSFGQFKNLQKGQITIGCSSTIIRNVLINCLTEFSNKYPNITVTIIDGTSDNLFNFLKQGKVDLVVTYSPLKPLENLNKIDLIEIQDCFIAGQAYKHLKGQTLSSKELSKIPLITQTQNRFYFDQVLKQNNLSLVPKMEMESFWLIVDFVKKGAGIGFSIKDFMKKDFESGDIFEVKTSLNIPKRKIQLYTTDDYSKSFAVKSFITFVQNYFC